ncbi:type II secretion system protein [Hydrogenimonas sp.]
MNRQRQGTTRSAFTMIELIFVIVVIGILASIAMPKLWVTRTDAIISKGRAEVSTIRSAISTVRQKNMLEGSGGYPATLEDAGEPLFSNLLDYGMSSDTSPGHWSKSGNKYVYHIGYDKNATFEYNATNGRFECVSGECAALTQ